MIVGIHPYNNLFEFNMWVNGRSEETHWHNSSFYGVLTNLMFQNGHCIKIQGVSADNSN